MTFRTADLAAARLVHSGHGNRWHAVRPGAGRAECGRVLLDGPARYYEPPREISLSEICRSCAGRHYGLAKALGIVGS